MSIDLGERNLQKRGHMPVFKISKRFSFSRDDFETRQGSIKKGRNSTPCEYISSFYPDVTSFWNKATNIKNKKGCYVYSWNKRPIYIGKTCGKNGFAQECFHPEKLKKISDYIKGANSPEYKQCKQYLHIYFIYLEGVKECKALGEYIEEMETRLILKCVDNFGKGQLINTKKVNYKWSIRGFMGNGDHRSLKGASKEYKNIVDEFKCLLKK